MFLFIRLLLAHFLGDFPFQFDKIYKLKLTGLKGIIPHVAIIFACSAALSWPYLHLPLVWLFILFISITHLIQDSAKLNYGAVKHSFWAYILDQLTHAGIISLIFLTDLKNLQPPVDQANILVRIYSNNTLMVYCIGILFATYNGFFMIRCFHDTFIGKAQYSSFEKWYGMLERCLIVFLFILKWPFLLLLAILPLLRPMIFVLGKKHLHLQDNFVSFTEIILSWSIALLTGFILYFF